jgi:hypothetical protein
MARNESIGAPSGFHSPYSSTTLTPSASNALLMSSGRSLLAACVLGVRPTPTVSLALSTRLSFGINALNRRCLIWSHTVMTAEHVLAVELEPPATGAGGRSLSPMKTETFSTGTPSRSAAAWPITV